jgi:hypothetical protein
MHFGNRYNNISMYMRAYLIDNQAIYNNFKIVQLFAKTTGVETKVYFCQETGLK